MILKVALIVDDQKVDLFKDETIQLEDSIKDARDPAQIFTSYTQSFTVPATKTNNKLFKHYHNNRLIGTDNSFDARFKVDARLTVNGHDFRKGKIKLNSVQLKDNKPYAYSINFIGDGVDLRDTLENDDLSDLSYLSQFDHDYVLAEVEDGLEAGLGLNGSSVMDQYNGTTVTVRSIIYPLISHTNRYAYNSTSTPDFYNVDNTSEGLLHTQLKPAIKLRHIIDAIEDKYDITFSSDFFNQGNAEFDDLYMWCNRTKGNIESLGDNTTYFYEWAFTSGTATVLVETNGRLSMDTYAEPNGPKRSLELTYTTTITGSGNYDFRVYNGTVYNNSLLFEERAQTGNQTFVVNLETDQFTYYTPHVEIVSAGTITAIDVSLSAENSSWTGNHETSSATVTTGVYDPPAAVTPNDYVNIPAVIPKMSVMDFLRGIFKMYNLCHYKKADGTIYVDTMDNYYALGSAIDVTKYVDMSSHTVNAPVPFDRIAFKYTEPQYFLSSKRKELLNVEFGNASYDLGNVFDGGEYEIETGFSHMLFERLEDLNDNSLSNHLFGWAVDEDEGAYVDAPLILMRRGTQTGADITFQSGSTLTSYQRMCNDNGTRTIHFGPEFDEYTLDVATSSLYFNYWENYISELYGRGARIVNYRAKLPARFLLQYNLYDKLIVNGISHKINRLTIDLATGNADLELITEL